MCVSECDLGTPTMRWPRPDLSFAPRKRNYSRWVPIDILEEYLASVFRVKLLNFSDLE